MFDTEHVKTRLRVHIIAGWVHQLPAGYISLSLAIVTPPGPYPAQQHAFCLGCVLDPAYHSQSTFDKLHHLMARQILYFHGHLITYLSFLLARMRTQQKWPPLNPAPTIYIYNTSYLISAIIDDCTVMSSIYGAIAQKCFETEAKTL